MIKKFFLFFSFLIILFFIFCSIFPHLITSYNPDEQNLNEQLAPPNKKHILGQDKLGRDIFSRIIYGSKISIYIGFFTVFISVIIGTIIGSISGYFGGVVDNLIMRITDILLGFPGIILAILIMSVLGPGLNNIIIALTLTGWVGFCRLVRGQVLSLKEREYIVAAKVISASSFKIIFFHILPNIISIIIVKATFDVAGVIIAEASLSFLGLGTQPPTPSWGMMINESKQYIMIAPHTIIFPGLVVMILVFAINIVGDYLRDYFDPKSL